MNIGPYACCPYRFLFQPSGRWNGSHVPSFFVCNYAVVSYCVSSCVVTMFLFLVTEVELRNIIDKLAQFVARNGPEFEQMTKNKQKGNPKFSFLFGGEHFNYYQYKVTTEQAS